jgi:tetratricopeptide (TPR) repeat protein
MTGEVRIPPSPYERGVQALDEGRHGDALHAFEQAYHLNPHDPALHEAIGRLYYEQGNYRRAREYLQYAVHLAPRLGKAWYGLALVEEREGNSEQALALLRRALEIDPSDEVAARTLEGERSRARAARRLPLWQPARTWRARLVLHPPKQVGPDGRDRPAPLRAPPHCVNCYFRPGRARTHLYAVRYHWWNLGLVGMVFAGWLAYLIWTYTARERRFSFDPLYCATCAANRRLLAWAFGLLLALVPVFGLATLVAVSSARVLARSGLDWTIPAVLAAIAAACLLLAVLARLKWAGQGGVRLEVGGEEEAVFRFTSPEYEGAFRELNRAFLVDKPRPEASAEAESFLPGVEEDEEGHAAEPQTPPVSAPAAPPTDRTDSG